MEEEMTCGKGLAENSVFHSVFADFLSALADNLETHLKALDPNDENSRPEYEAYQELTKRHRELVLHLRSTGDLMANSRALPMATHDPAAMSSREALEAFESFVAREKDLLALLEKRVKQDAAMLASFRRSAE